MLRHIALCALMSLLACGGGPEYTPTIHSDTGTAEEPVPDVDPSTLDLDGDHYAAAEDCDDTDPAINPGAEEVCDDVDNDCDGEVDRYASDSTIRYLDADGDGWGFNPDYLATCHPEEYGEEYVALTGDCAPDDPSINPADDPEANNAACEALEGDAGNPAGMP